MKKTISIIGNIMLDRCSYHLNNTQLGTITTTTWPSTSSHPTRNWDNHIHWDTKKNCDVKAIKLD